MSATRLAGTVILLACVLVPAPAAAQVRGRVTDSASGEPVNGAPVWLAGRTLHLAHSDAAGEYAFQGVAPGGYCIRVITPGHEPARVCITLSAGASMVVDLPLTPRPLAMEPLVVRGRRGVDERSTRAASDSVLMTPLSRRLSLIGRRSSELAAAQLTELTGLTAYEPPGGRRPHALYVWGSGAERGRVLLDGASLSAPLHLGTLLPPVDPAVIDRADVHTGGISPRLDGGTAYIMDIATRSAAGPARMWGELDLLAARVGAESPINGRGRVIVSARRVNDEIIDRLVTSRFGYGYADALVRADADVSERSGVHLTAFATDEAISIPRDLGEDRASWRNRAATLVWRSSGAGETRAATLSASRGTADLPLLSAPGGHLEATLDRVRGVAERDWSVGSMRWDAGVELEHLVFRRRARASADPRSGVPGAVACTPALPCSHANATLAAAFAELFLPAARGVTMNVGARAMYDITGRSVHLLPRAALSFVPSAKTSFTLSAGRFSQPYVADTAVSTNASAVDAAADVRIAHAVHIEAGVVRRTDGLELHGSAWLRRHAAVEPTGPARTVPGADLSVEYGWRRGTLGLAYTVSGGRADDASGLDSRARHLASAGVETRHGRWQLNVNAAYGAGMPLTSIVLEQPVDAEAVLQPVTTIETGGTPDLLRAADRQYLRVDASIGAEWRIGRAENGVLIAPYARIINTLGQRESLFYYQDSGDVSGPPRALAPLPTVPVIGVRWHF
ncbi:MAG TPA: carboxypeptidase regulatory-like domain-containing protein [Longimicrobiales bacterium]